MIPYLLFAALCALIVTSHALAAFGSPRVQAIGVTVGLVLHVPLLLLLLYMSFSMELAIVTFLASIAVHSTLGAWGYTRARRASARAEACEGTCSHERGGNA